MSAIWPVAVRCVGWVPGDLPADLELGAPQAGGTYERALVVLERDGVPWGVVGVVAPEGIVAGATLARAVEDQITGEPWATVPESGPAGARTPLRVVITSRQDAWRVVRAVSALVARPDPGLEVVVVDQHPDTEALGPVLAEAFPDEPRLTVLQERRPGRAHARNRGAEGLADGLVAFLDDELVAHPGWADRMREAIGHRDGVGLGHVLPLALETEAQWLWYRASAGAGGAAAAQLGPPAPWTPARAGAFAGGLSMSAAVFAEIGGFDTRLGPGTPSRGGDELDIILRARRAGCEIWNVPRAVVWREYPDVAPALEREAFARGVSVSATMAKQLVDGAGPGARARSASAALRVGHTMRLRAMPDGAPRARAPRRLVALERLGLIAGPAAFARSALRGRDAAR